MKPLIDPAAASEILDHARAVHVFRLDRRGTIEACNEGAARTLGLPAGQIAGRSLGQFLTATDAARLDSELVKVGRRADRILLNFCGALHAPYTLECWLDVHDAGATLVGEPPLADDHKRQRELLKVNEQLAMLSRERVKLVEAERRARLEAETANREKDAAIATIAHELRQPLAPLRIGVELLKGDITASARERAIRVIERQAAQLARLIDDLLDAVRVREHKVRLHRGPVDIVLLLADVAEGLQGKAADAGVALEYERPVVPVWVEGDGGRLVQVFSNLLDNALKYTDRGGRVTLSVRLQGGTAVASVRDTGRGIPPQVLPRVFRMFAQQAEGERGGLGIGLAVAASIVAMHGGTIEAHSAGPGAGSEFVVALPLLTEQLQTSGIA